MKAVDKKPYQSVELTVYGDAEGIYTDIISSSNVDDEGFGPEVPFNRVF